MFQAWFSLLMVYIVGMLFKQAAFCEQHNYKGHMQQS